MVPQQRFGVRCACWDFEIAKAVMARFCGIPLVVILFALSVWCLISQRTDWVGGWMSAKYMMDGTMPETKTLL